MLLRKKVTAFNIDEIREDLDLFDQNETPVEKLSAEELTNLIQTLPHGYLVVFNLYVIDGYTHPEIAEKLNIGSGTSKSQLFKARKLIQSKLEVLLSTEEYDYKNFKDLDHFFKSRLQKNESSSNGWDVPSIAILENALTQINLPKQNKKRRAFWIFTTCNRFLFLLSITEQ